MAEDVEGSWGWRILRWVRSRRFVVQDESLVPLLLPGDRVRVDPGAYRNRVPRPGEIVVLSDPEHLVGWLIKKVDEVTPPAPEERGGEVLVSVVGINPQTSRDSRRFGPVPSARILGQAYFRYFPASRRGPLDGRDRREGPPDPSMER